jgi:hypothetical protein
MGAMSVRFPESLQEHLREYSKREGVSINQFVINAVAEKMSAKHTEDIISQRAKLGSRDEFLSVLSKAPDIEPDECDRID